MANIVDTHRFVAGMDLDSESRYVSPDSTRLQRNTRYDGSLQATAGATTNLLGNELMGLGAFELFGTPTVIGSCFDEKRDDVIFFVHNTNGHHTIFSYNIYTGAVIRRLISDEAYWVKDGSALDFSLTNRIHDAQVIGDVLYFRDNKRPRRLNLLKSINIGAPNNYPYIDNSVIDAIKYPPLQPCEAVLNTDFNRLINSIRGSSFQFRYRYLYDDFGYSVCSPISKPCIPKSGYSYNGDWLQEQGINNVIDVTVKTGGCSVIAIDILARIGNSGDWFIAHTLNKKNLGIADNDTYLWKFYNNSMVSAVDQNDISRPFDYLPKLANSQALLDGKYLSYGGCLQGFDNIPVFCGLNVVKEALPTNPASNTNIFSYIVDQYQYNALNSVSKLCVIFVDAGLLPIVAANPNYIMAINIEFYKSEAYINGDTKEYALDPAGNANSVQSLHDAIKSYINTDFNGIAKAGDTLPVQTPPIPEEFPFPLSIPAELAVFPWEFLGYYPTEVRVRIDFYEKGTGTTKRIYGGAKSGATHKFGLVYSDEAGRLSTVQTDDTLEIYVKNIHETAIGEISANSNNFRNRIDWEIFHSPPEWATKYHWVYAGRKEIGAYRQYVIGGGDPSDTAIWNEPGDDVSTYVSLAALNRLTLAPTYENGTFVINNPSVHFPIPNSLLEPYIFTKGDRIKFLTSPVDVTTPPEYPLGERIVNRYDVEILGYVTDVDADNVDVIRIQRINFDSEEINKGTLVEIYTPRKSYSDDVYYEMGETYDIVTTPGGIKVHSVVSGSFETVDVVHMLRAMPYRIAPYPGEVAGRYMFWVESDNFSDFFESPVFCNGRINLYDATAEEKYYDIIRRSNPYFAETKTNGLGSFEYDKYLPLGSEYGDITKIIQVGYTLKILQERKLTSVYVGKNGLRQAGADGAQVVVATDNVFNTTNPSELPYGCADPDSVVVRERQMFFFDRNSKCIVRDSANGPVDISSEWKVSGLIRPLADSIATNGGLVIAGANNKYGEILFTFAPTGEIGETVCLSQKYGNCKSILDFYGLNAETPSAYINAGDYFYAFMNGRMWLQDVNPIRGSFFGTEHEMEISFVSNMNPQTVKVYDSIVQNANKKFTSENYSDIIIAVNENQPLGMMSKLTASQYKSEEGVWIAPFLRNAVTRSATPNVYDLINGDPLRGQYMTITIRNNDTSEVILHSVIINCTHSPLTR